MYYASMRSFFSFGDLGGPAVSTMDIRQKVQFPVGPI